MRDPVKKVLLIVVDTLRADHVGCYGYPLATSPTIDELSKESVMYRYAFSPGSYTVPVHASIFTGKIPSNHSLWFYQGKGQLNRDREITLAEILKQEGYQTAAFVSSYVMRRDWGLDAGFDIYDDRMTTHESNRPEEPIRDGKETNQILLRYLEEKRPEKFFFFVHYFDVHGPYVKNLVKNVFHPDQYGSHPILLNRVRNGSAGGIPEYQLLRVEKNAKGDIVQYERDARIYMAQYDAGIRYADEVIAQLLDRLKGLGIYEDTMIILTSDHGEALGENGVYFFHGLTVSVEQIRIPLMIKYPGSRLKGQVSEVPVSSVDIMPTILESCGIDMARFRFDGYSLLRGPQEPSSRFILSENPVQRAIVGGEHVLLAEKGVIDPAYVYYFNPGALVAGKQFYHYVTDPKGIRNLLGERSQAEDFLRFESLLSHYVDPKEQMIGEKDRLLGERDRRLEGAEARLQSLLNSWSWKVTAPLRWLYGKWGAKST